MKKILILLLVSITIFACNKTKMNIDVTGVVLVYDNENKIISSDGVNVTITKADKSGSFLNINTDKTGVYTFENIPSGTYDIIFKKNNCPEITLKSVQILGQGEMQYIEDVHIAEYIDVNISIKDTVISYSNYIKLTNPNYETNNKFETQIFLSNSQEVSDTNYENIINISFNNNGIALMPYFIINNYQYLVAYCKNDNYLLTKMQNDYGVEVNPYLKKSSIIFKTKN